MQQAYKGAAFNAISGPLPIEVSMLLPALESIAMVEAYALNNITHLMPIELTELPRLTSLIIHDEAVTGTLPSEHLAMFTDLQVLD